MRFQTFNFIKIVVTSKFNLLLFVIYTICSNGLQVNFVLKLEFFFVITITLYNIKFRM